MIAELGDQPGTREQNVNTFLQRIRTYQRIRLFPQQYVPGHGERQIGLLSKLREREVRALLRDVEVDPRISLQFFGPSRRRNTRQDRDRHEPLYAVSNANSPRSP